MRYPHALADIAALILAPPSQLRSQADRWVAFAAEYDQVSGRVTDYGRALLLAEYTDDHLEFHPQYRPNHEQDRG